MKTKKKVIVTAVAMALSCIIAVPSFAATSHWNDNASKTSISTDWANWKTKWDSVKNNFEQISITPGKTESSLNFAWYSKNTDEAKVRFSTTKDMNDSTESTGSSVSYKSINDTPYYSNRVTLTGLKSNSVYYYQYYLDSAWTPVKKFKTQDTDEFQFLYVGDPQIGASVGQTATGDQAAQNAELAARNDAFSWNTTLNSAIDANPNVSFMISAGDQINESASNGSTAKDLQQEIEYAGYLSPRLMSTLPVATTIGNHDSMTANYQNHFNNPNSYTAATTPTKAGNDYYFTYGDALFMFIDTNNYNVADHEALIKMATEANPDAKWRIITYHQDIYGSGLDHSDSDGIILRTQLTTLFDKYDIDVALQGHDHTYSRSYQLTSDGAAHTAYDSSVKLSDPAVKADFLNQNLCYKIVSQDATNNVVTNPQGVLYMEANSSTGSKFYDLIASQQNYIASRSQTWTPTYSVVDVTNNTLTINTFDVSTGNKIDTPYTISKPDVIAATGVTLKDTSKNLSVGDTYTLEAMIVPTNTSDKTLTWSSSDASIATVSTTGVVQGKKAGIASITVTTSNGKTATCKITVNPSFVAVTGVSLNPTSKTINVGDKLTLIGTVAPSSATDKTLSWMSSDNSVATVTNGVVTAKSTGNVTIIAISSNGKVGTSSLTVNAQASKITVDVTSKVLYIGSSFTLHGTIAPSNTTNKSVVWKTSNNKVATVTSSGVVKAINAGTATITVTTSNGKSATCIVTVKPVLVSNLKLSAATTLKVKSTLTVKATITPTYATNKSLIWTSSNTKIATVSSSGVVKGVKAGKVTIIATTKDGSKKTAKITITIKK